MAELVYNILQVIVDKSSGLPIIETELVLHMIGYIKPFIEVAVYLFPPDVLAFILVTQLSLWAYRVVVALYKLLPFT